MLRRLARTITTSLLAVAAGANCQGGKPTLRVGDQTSNSGYVPTEAAVSEPVTDVDGIDAGCALSMIRGQLRPSNLLFLIDRSGSMACNLPSDGQSSAECDQFPIRRFPEKPSKWELTIAALNSALQALKGSGRVSVAMTEFPLPGSSCTIASQPQLAFRPLDDAAATAVIQTIGATQPYGNTPMVGALLLGYQYILNQIRNGLLDGETFVVLLTDGRETCRPDEVDHLLRIDAPNANQLLGVRTFVIGVPGSEDAREFLSELAEAGGTVRSDDCYYGPEPSDGNCHFDMTTSASFASDLLDALTKINAEILSCTFDVPEGSGVDLTRINVALNSHSLRYVNGGSCSEGSEGWQYTPGNMSIRLCGAACAEAQQPGSAVSIVLGCPTNVW